MLDEATPYLKVDVGGPRCENGGRSVGKKADFVEGGFGWSQCVAEACASKSRRLRAMGEQLATLLQCKWCRGLACLRQGQGRLGSSCRRFCENTHDIHGLNM